MAVSKIFLKKLILILKNVSRLQQKHEKVPNMQKVENIDMLDV